MEVAGRQQSPLDAASSSSASESSEDEAAADLPGRVSTEVSPRSIGDDDRWCNERFVWHTPCFERQSDVGDRQARWCIKLSWEWRHTGGSEPDDPACYCGACTLYVRRNLEPWKLVREDVSGTSVVLPLNEGDHTGVAHWIFLRPQRDDVAPGPVLGPLVQPPVPGPVREITAAEVAPGVISVSWEPPVMPSLRCLTSPVVDYEVLFENERHQQALAVSVGTRLVVRNVDPNHCYSIQVCALNEAGRGPYSIAPRSIDVRGIRRRMLPLDGCALLPWRDESLAPIPPERHHSGFLGVSARIVGFLATIALDVELTASFCYKDERPLVVACFLSVYLISALIATRLAEAVERCIPPFVIASCAKFLAAVAIALFHMHASTRGFQDSYVLSPPMRPFMDVMVLILQRCPSCNVGFVTQSELFRLVLRACIGGCAAVIKHIIVHVASPDAVESTALTLVEDVLLCKCAPLGFIVVAILSNAGVPHELGMWWLARILILLLIISATLGLLLDPHCRRPAAALIRHKVSMLVLMRKYMCLCEAEARRAVSESLPVGEGLNSQASRTLLQWSGVHRPIWIWSARSRSLLQDCAPLLGLREPSTLVGLGALLRRRLLGAEQEVIRFIEAARLSCHTRGSSPTLLSSPEQHILIALLTIAAAMGQPRRTDSILLTSSETSGHRRPELFYNVAELHLAFTRVRKFSPLALPSEALATTLLVSLTSKRSWLSCLGCASCCSAARLRDRLCVDTAINALHSAKHDGAAPQNSSIDWHGCCPSWASFVSTAGGQSLTQACGRHHEAWLLALLNLTQMDDAAKTVNGVSSGDVVQRRQLATRVGSEKEQAKEEEELRKLTQQIKRRHGMILPTAKPSSYEETLSRAIHTFGVEVMHAAEAENDASLGYAFMCLFRNTDEEGCSTSVHFHDGLHLLAARLLREFLSREHKDSVKPASRMVSDKAAAKRTHSALARARRLIVALLRMKYFFKSTSARSTLEAYILATEWHSCCISGGKEDLRGSGRDGSSQEEQFCLDVVHRVMQKDVAGIVVDADVQKACDTVNALTVCSADIISQVLSALLNDIDPKAGKIVAGRVVALVAWIDAERSDIVKRMRNGQLTHHRIDTSMLTIEREATDVLVLNASLALGYRSSFQLLAASQAARIVARHCAHRCAEEAESAKDHSSNNEGGLCLGAVLQLLSILGGEDAPDLLLRHFAATAAHSHAWMPFLMFLNEGCSHHFMGAIAAGGGDSVPWAPTSQRSTEEAEFMRVFTDFLVRIARTSMLPPPQAVEDERQLNQSNDKERLLTYFDRHGNGLLGAGDAAWLLETVAREPCDQLTYAETCIACGCQPGVGLTVGVAKHILEQVDRSVLTSLCAMVSSAHNEMESEIAKASKQRLARAQRVEATLRRAWGLTDALELWLTHFFGCQGAQGIRAADCGQAPDAGTGVAYDDEQTSSGLRRYLSWRTSLEAKRRVAALRGILALQGRPRELARAWRAAAERGAITTETGDAWRQQRRRPQKKRSSLLKRVRSIRTRDESHLLRVLPYAVDDCHTGDDDCRRRDEEEEVPMGIIVRAFRDDFCHSRTVMTQDGLRREEARNLTALRQLGGRGLLKSAHGWFTDSYVWPALISIMIHGIFEAGLFALIPTLLFRYSTEQGGVAGTSSAALSSGIILTGFQVGQIIGAIPQSFLLRAIENCRLPAAPGFITLCQHRWEQMALWATVLSVLGAAAWRIAIAYISRDVTYVPHILPFVVAALAFGVCRPFAETMLFLRPRRGHIDGRRKVPHPNIAYVIRTLTAAIFAPLLLTSSVKVWNVGFRITVMALLPEFWAFPPSLGSEQLFGETGLALSALGGCLQLLPLLALVPWTVSASKERLYAHPVRRALHYCPPYGGNGHGGPVVVGRPVVANVSASLVQVTWSGPGSTMPLIYCVEVSIEYGDWLRSDSMSIIWPSNRGQPHCHVPISAFPSGGRTVRFRVRCAPAPALYTKASHEAPLLWGPWSLPSLAVRRPSGLRLPPILRPLVLLTFAPFSIVDYLFVALPRAWLTQISARVEANAGDSSGSLLTNIVHTLSRVWLALPLLAIFPLVLAHLMIWALPRAALLYFRRSSKGNRCCRVAAACILLPIWPATLLLSMIHALCQRVRRARQVELVRAIDVSGPFLDLTVRGEVDVETSTAASDAFSDAWGDVMPDVRAAVATNDEMQGVAPIELHHLGHIPKLNAASDTEIWLDLCAALPDTSRGKLCASDAPIAATSDRRIVCSVAADTAAAGLARVVGAPVVVIRAGELMALHKEGEGYGRLAASLGLNSARVRIRNALLLLHTEVSAESAASGKDEAATPTSPGTRESHEPSTAEICDAAASLGAFGLLVDQRAWKAWPVAAESSVLPVLPVLHLASAFTGELLELAAQRDLLVATLVTVASEILDGIAPGRPPAPGTSRDADGGESESGGESARACVEVSWKSSELSDPYESFTGVLERFQRRADAPVLALQQWRQLRVGRGLTGDGSDVDDADGTWCCCALSMGNLSSSIRVPLVHPQGPCRFRLLAPVRDTWQPITDVAIHRPASASGAAGAGTALAVVAGADVAVPAAAAAAAGSAMTRSSKPGADGPGGSAAAAGVFARSSTASLPVALQAALERRKPIHGSAAGEDASAAPSRRASAGSGEAHAAIATTATAAKVAAAFAASSPTAKDRATATAPGRRKSGGGRSSGEHAHGEDAVRSAAEPHGTQGGAESARRAGAAVQASSLPLAQPSDRSSSPNPPTATELSAQRRGPQATGHVQAGGLPRSASASAQDAVVPHGGIRPTRLPPLERCPTNGTLEDRPTQASGTAGFGASWPRPPLEGAVSAGASRMRRAQRYNEVDWLG